MEELIRTINLENSLKLNLYDGSRKIAGDRWFVLLIARIDISVNGIQMDKDTSVTSDEIRKALGETVRFEQKRDRNFVEQSKKDDVLNELADSFLSASLSYLSHPDFARRFVLRQFKIHMQRSRFYQR